MAKKTIVKQLFPFPAVPVVYSQASKSHSSVLGRYDALMSDALVVGRMAWERERREKEKEKEPKGD